MLSSSAPTGSGKSTFLRNLAVQTFGLGATTCIIEPHGDLCLDVLAGIPQGARTARSISPWIAPRPFSLPLMTVGLSAGIDVAVGAVMSALRMAGTGFRANPPGRAESLRHVIRTLLDVLGCRPACFP